MVSDRILTEEVTAISTIALRELEEQVMSVEKLVDTYEALEDRVETLNQKLSKIDLRRQQESEEKAQLTYRLEALLNMLPAGVVVLDPKGIICQCNQAAEEILETKLMGQKWSTIVTELYDPTCDDGLEVSLTNGRKISVATSALEHEPGQIILLTDLTQTRALQDRLSQQKRLSALGRMMASVAHQIRTPLSTALLYASHLTKPNLTNENIQTFSQRIKERLTTLDQLLESMLCFVKGGVPTIEAIPLSQLIREIELSVGEQVKEYGANLQILNQAPLELVLNGNLKALTGAISNLVINSLQAVGLKADIKVMIELLEENQIEIVVSDQGPGIPEEHLARIWEPFYTTKATGTGLGLSVVKVVAEALNGSAWIKTAKETGTQVGIRLPIRKES